MTTDGKKSRRDKPRLGQRSAPLQPFGAVVYPPVGLSQQVLRKSVEDLTLLLADTMYLRDMYKKHHWQVSGPTFYALHLLFDKHYKEQSELVDELAERIQSLGGVALAMPNDVAELTRLEQPPRDREEVPVQLSRLIEAHEHILVEARQAAKRAEQGDDDGTHDLLVSGVIRTGEMHVWFLTEHLVPGPLVIASEEGAADAEAEEANVEAGAPTY
jgi:starvation-inducible DNA-binding protein